ncbi:serine/threonine-protein kinase [Okibacterium fritillariae]|uniref:serine/threonine-protein kinase n=1 Tax=Okibacterium fritillariae TaxID=123320 RepID=UPI0040559887
MTLDSARPSRADGGGRDSGTGSGHGDGDGRGDNDVVAGRYRVDTLIGRGGMAAVYRAQDLSLGRTVALKLFAAAGESEKDEGRKTSEIRLLASLKHHALVTLYDASDGSALDGEPAFMAMELVEGPTLSQLLDAGPLDRREVARMGADLAEALHVVHAAGIVHRDLKPSNVLLEDSTSPDRRFRVKLADFGIAYMVDSTRLTMPGTLVGTAAYLSPEQAKGEPPTPASDVYSLGLVLLESLTGERAFPGSMIEAATARLLRDPVVPESVGADWAGLLVAMTNRDPEQRPDALSVARSIHEFSTTGNQESPVAADATAMSTVAAPLPQTDVPDASAGAGAAKAGFESAGSESAGDAPTRAFELSDVPTTEVDRPSSEHVRTEHHARTERFPQTPAVVPSRSHDEAPTVAAPVADRPEQSGMSAAPRNRSGRRAVIVVVVFAVLLLAAIAIAIAVAASGGSSPDQTPLPEVTGPLGVHLQQLRDEVNQ